MAEDRAPLERESNAADGDTSTDPASSGSILDDPSIAQLRHGETVEVHRYIPATKRRPAHTRSWVVVVDEIIHPAIATDGWILVPKASSPPHPIDFHIGVTGHGMRTHLRRPR